MGVGSRIESDDYKAWKMHDYALMLLLTATLSSSAISYVIGSTSSREMWVCLQNHFFLPSTKTSIIKLQTYLYNMTKGSDSISQFLRRIKEARDGLSVLGVTLADEDFVLIALNGLPATYNTFKCVIRRREGVISLENFRQQLLAEEAIVDCASVTKFGDCQTQEIFDSRVVVKGGSITIMVQPTSLFLTVHLEFLAPRHLHILILHHLIFLHIKFVHRRIILMMIVIPYITLSLQFQPLNHVKAHWINNSN
ncbi:hypothetical protein C1H46_041266 [Malus baccata]|uniref:Retrotransposon Copia-like N-terminal domain-containing protein n=1 Tax=Malus baccata TaxID=106549 RepID=A0A540KG22_MALBA|nr:hypothetical protein C1H46_041266 [Malus baccata]